MTVNVVITYNPYLPQVTFLINGKCPSEYSKLIYFSDEDIFQWSGKVFNVLYEELRDDFLVHFVGTDFDAEIMRLESEKNLHCLKYTVSHFSNDLAVQKRLGIVNQVLKENSRISFKRIAMTFAVLPSSLSNQFQSELKRIRVANSFCSICADSIMHNGINVMNVVLANDYKEGLQIAKQNYSHIPLFIFFLGRTCSLREVDNNCLLFEDDFNDIVKSLLDCFIGFPLTKAMQYCRKILPDDLKKCFKIRKAYAIDSLININIVTAIEVGKSNGIEVAYDPPTDMHPHVLFQVLDRKIADTDGISVFGKRQGTTLLEAYQYGAKTPFEVFPIQVFERNRIKSIILDETEVVLGTGDKRNISITYYPENADNADTISWQTTDAAVAVVDDRGTITALTPGICRIYCSAENVSASYACEVKPYAESMSILLPDQEKNHLSMKPMEEIDMNIVFSPRDCIDSNVAVTISDLDVINVIGRKIVAKKPGVARIFIQNISRHQSAEIEIRVLKPSLFSKLLGI